jgi:hypothetical protein
MSTASPNLTNFKYSIAILLSIIIGMSFYIYQKNANQNSMKALVLVDKNEKKATLKDLEFLKSKYDAVIGENVNLSSDVFNERQKVIALIAEIKSERSSTYFKNKLADIKSTMLVLLDENYKLKLQKNQLANTKNDTLYDSYRKLYQANKNLLIQNKELSNAVKKGATLSISNFKATTFRVKNSGKLVATRLAKRANYLKINYTINENLLSKSEDKTFYTQIIDPNNNVVGETKSLAIENELKYTFANKIEYNNKPVDINHSLPFGTFIKGKYYITIFDFDGVVGKATFIMQ